MASTSLPAPSIVMPRTPPAGRPIARTSSSSKRTVSPPLETIRISAPRSTRRTATSSSSSRMPIAMMPSALIGVLYSANRVFLTSPFFVPKTRYSASAKSRVESTDWIRSPSRSGRTLTNARPFAVREASGSSYLGPVDLAAIGEEQQVVVRRAHEEVLDVVAVLHVHPGHADAPAPLLTVGSQRQRLDVAAAGDRDD